MGSNVVKLAVSRFRVLATYHTHQVGMKDVDFFPVDLTEPRAVKTIQERLPDYIIHCAAQTNVDYCEEHPKEAYQQNVAASRYIAQAAHGVGAYLVHISTDAVFDGQQGNYNEENVPNPIQVYGQTKKEAEDVVLLECPNACVVRTNIFGWNKLGRLSLAEWMLQKLRKKEELPGFKDVVFSPILINNLAEVLFELLELKYKGILHIAGASSMSKLDFAYTIADVFDLDRQVIKSVSMRDVPLKAPRARDTSLDISKARRLFKTEIMDIWEGLEEMERLERIGYVQELRNGGA